MFGLKKKLGGMIPNEGTRGALQNMLTVEWEGGNKTVLVELPAAGSSRSNEMELSGFSKSKGGRDEMEEGLNRSYGGYGKLDDDDDEYGSDGFNRSRMAQQDYLQPPSHLSRNKTAPALPSRNPAARPTFNRPEWTENPFDSPLSSSEYLPPKTLPKSHSYAAPRSNQDWESDYFSHQKSASTNWTTFDRSPMEDESPRMTYPSVPKKNNGKSIKPATGDWKSDPWNRGSAGWSETTSPTSSNGSINQDIENPFRG